MQTTNNHLQSTAASVWSQYSVREFASETRDLDVDFDKLCQPQLAMRIVAKCLLYDNQCIAPSEVLSWSLKKRLQALLAITIATGAKELLLHSRCKDPDCAEVIELALDLSRFRQDSEDAEFSFEVAETSVKARLPNGADQLRWLQQQYQSETEIARALVVRVGDKSPGDNWDFPLAWLPVFSESLEQQDELMTLCIESSCPACTRELDIAMDLETQLLESLSKVQQKLLLEIHQIASAYHWSEAQIVRLTQRRRHFYLNQLGAASAQGQLQ